MKYLHARHYKERSNRELYIEICIAALQMGDCFVPRNDVFYF